MSDPTLQTYFPHYLPELDDVCDTETYDLESDIAEPYSEENYPTCPIEPLTEAQISQTEFIEQIIEPRLDQVWDGTVQESRQAIDEVSSSLEFFNQLDTNGDQYVETSEFHSVYEYSLGSTESGQPCVDRESFKAITEDLSLNPGSFSLWREFGKVIQNQLISQDVNHIDRIEFTEECYTRPKIRVSQKTSDSTKKEDSLAPLPDFIDFSNMPVMREAEANIGQILNTNPIIRAHMMSPTESEVATIEMAWENATDASLDSFADSVYDNHGLDIFDYELANGDLDIDRLKDDIQQSFDERKEENF